MSVLNHSPSITREGLVLCFDAQAIRCYSGSGTTVKNLVSTSDFGTLSNATFSSDPGANGKKFFDFDGSNDKIEVPNSDAAVKSALESTEFTVEAVFKADSSQNNPFPRIYQKGNTLLHLSQTSPFAIYQNIYDNSSPSALFTQAGAGSFVVAGQWVHVVATWDGNASVDRIKIYKNAQVFTSATGSASGTANISTSSLYLGATSDTSRDLNGQIAIFRIYNRVLTQKEIRKNYESQIKPRFGLTD
tara:strand:- start:47 stop:784 length:738 start_codon:yes stop_codon:yes gene_type:complete